MLIKVNLKVMQEKDRRKKIWVGWLPTWFEGAMIATGQDKACLGHQWRGSLALVQSSLDIQRLTRTTHKWKLHQGPTWLLSLTTSPRAWWHV